MFNYLFVVLIVVAIFIYFYSKNILLNQKSEWLFTFITILWLYASLWF